MASNIVEGCARNSEADFPRFLDMAYGSVRETDYQIGLAHRLGYLPDGDFESLSAKSKETGKPRPFSGFADPSATVLPPASSGG